MKSTDHNINNPLKVMNLNLLKTIERLSLPETVSLPQEVYDIMAIHEPNTAYIINDSEDGRMYIGDKLIMPIKNINKYFIGQDSSGNYIIYINQYFNSHKLTQSLIPICTYDDPQTAIDALSRFNKVGSHHKRDFKVYLMIRDYIDKLISTHDLIVGIMTIVNYDNDPRLQEILAYAVAHNVNKSMKEFPAFYADQIAILRDRCPDSLFPIYSNLYDLIVKYNFFNDRKYQSGDEDINLSEEISDVFKILLNTQIKFNK